MPEAMPRIVFLADGRPRRVKALLSPLRPPLAPFLLARYLGRPYDHFADIRLPRQRVQLPPKSDHPQKV